VDEETPQSPAPGAAIERLDGGLVLRRATVADAAELEAFNAAIHGGPDEPDASIGIWTRDLLTRPHPTFGAGGYAVVEDGATGKIVSTLNLIPQTWSYGGVAFGVGRVELVGTLPAYRRRGLIRRQMEEAHRWSAALGHTVQMITGISHFYQQFGYEQGLAMYGARAGARHRIPRLATGASEPYRVRPATAQDADFLARVEQTARPRYLLSVVRDAALWRYELEGMSAGHSKRRLIRIVEAGAGAGAARAEGEALGYVVLREGRAPVVTVVAYELLPGVSWLAVTPSVLRAIGAYGDSLRPEGEGPGDAGQRFERFRLQLAADHPAYHVLPDRLTEHDHPDPEYVRVPDLPAFLRLIAPVLEDRLAASFAAGHSGRLRLSFFGDGVLLRFREGRLEEVVSCPHVGADEDAGPIRATFPGHSFLQVLFGCRSLEALEGSFADCRAFDEEARVLLRALFPKRPSQIWPVS
jgi:GNAT superfamily N-acetyltransferase